MSPVDDVVVVGFVVVVPPVPILPDGWVVVVPVVPVVAGVVVDVLLPTVFCSPGAWFTLGKVVCVFMLPPVLWVGVVVVTAVVLPEDVLGAVVPVVVFFTVLVALGAVLVLVALTGNFFATVVVVLVVTVWVAGLAAVAAFAFTVVVVLVLVVVVFTVAGAVCAVRPAEKAPINKNKVDAFKDIMLFNFSW